MNINDKGKEFDKGKKVKILLIDDDDMMRIYFRDIFWIHSRRIQYEVNKQIWLTPHMKQRLMYLEIKLLIKLYHTAYRA